MTKAKTSEGYTGPWLKFSRARSRDGFPILSVTKNGVGWKRLSPQQSWDIMVILRGPDKSITKDATTARVRGLFLNWSHSSYNFDRARSISNTGCYAYRPDGNMIDEVSIIGTMEEEEGKLIGGTRHFNRHWNDVRAIILHYLGGWPLEV